MIEKPFFVKKEDNGQYILYRKTPVSNDVYVMSFRYRVEADEVCHQLNLESIRFNGLYHEYKKVNEELSELKRAFWEYRHMDGDLE